MNSQPYFYPSGEFAKLAGVNKRTLHYYNDIGLFCPQIVGENGYHYYSCFQFAQLEPKVLQIVRLLTLHWKISYA